MKFGAWPTLAYEWRAPLPPREFAQRLQDLIRDEHRICGEVMSHRFRSCLGRTPGYQRSTYLALVEASEEGSLVRATVLPSLRARGARSFLYLGLILGSLSLFAGAAGAWFPGVRKEMLALAGSGVAVMAMSTVIFYLNRAAHWLDGEEIQAYLLDRFRGRVVVKNFQKLP